MSKKTKQPTGLSIGRSGNKFTLSWHRKAKNHSDGQQFQYVFDDEGKDKWHPKKNFDIGKTATSKAAPNLDKSDYYPNSGKKVLYEIRMRVRGNSNESGCGWSNWAKKGYKIEKPNKPSVSFALESQENVGTFSWSAENCDDGKHKVHTRVQWETILVKDCNESEGDKQPWKSSQLGYETGTSTAQTGTKTITEDSSLFSVAGYSYTRWFRIQAQGPRGDSDWVYAKHVYAKPSVTTDVKPEDPIESAGAYYVPISWTAPADNQFPIDQVVVQYTFQKPADVNLSCPTTGVDWSDAATLKDTENLDGSIISIDRTVDKDECLYIRINTYHDTKVTYGNPVLTKVGYLKDPSNISVSINDETHRATITATNNSEVSTSVLGIIYQGSTGKTVEVGQIAHGSNSATVQCPNWSGETAISFKVYAYVGAATTNTVKDEDGTTVYTSYSSNAKMKSENTISDGGAVPKAPTDVTANKVSADGTVQVSWNWDWADASGAELSWSDHEDAWESTDEPSTFEVSTIKASHWNIHSLELGKIWYIRVRLFKRDGETITYGPYSNTVSIKLLSAPNTPALSVSSSIVSPKGTTIANWVYVSTDTTAQVYAEIARVTVSEGTPSYEVIAKTETAQHIKLDISKLNWSAGIYDIVLRVKSASGLLSEWSNKVSITVAPNLVCSVTNPFTPVTLVDDDGLTRIVDSLRSLPLSVTVSGVDNNGVSTAIIERAESYNLNRPDEDASQGFEGETVAMVSKTGSGVITITSTDVYGSLDDGAKYNLVVEASNTLGQHSSVSIPFEVHWLHQASKPSYTISMDPTAMVAHFTPIAPNDAINTDVCDIYRLSVDKPELVYRGATFGTEYVDPYPTLGQFGGYRFVTRTANGDFTEPDGGLAETDTESDGLLPNEQDYNIIDFDGDQVIFYYDSDFSSSWDKDFKETKYLGGSIQGDWNPAVSRTGSLSSLVITTLDQELIQSLHRLAAYTGICHVRTSDGSSYAADVQVSKEVSHSDLGMLETYSLNITKVSTQGFDAVTIDEWEEAQA